MALIDPHKAAAIIKSYAIGEQGDYLDGIADAVHCVLNTPKVDAVPVVYGHWIEHRYGTTLDPWCVEYYCSVCNHSVENAPRYYCPECGADMRSKSAIDGLLRYCSSCGVWCAYATEMGYCKLTACVNRPFPSNRTLTEEELYDMQRRADAYIIRPPKMMERDSSLRSE